METIMQPGILAALKPGYVTPLVYSRLNLISLPNKDENVLKVQFSSLGAAENGTKLQILTDPWIPSNPKCEELP